MIFSLSCGSKPTDMRSLVPAETLVYLETNDLAAALQPIVDSKPFNEVAKTKPDFSALKGVQLAVAVTGFETSEEKLTDEHSVGRVQPHFVAIAETHAWQFQTVRFAEQKLGSFVAEMYGSEPTLESSEKGGGHYFVWTAKDGRKAFAVVSRSLIYFGNDESAIEKCLAVKRGEADSIIKTGKVNLASQGTLASGYVSTDGVAQIANIVGLKFATEAGEDSEVQSAIAGILPQLIRNSVTDISWTSTKTEQGIVDKYQIGMPSEMATVFNETMAPGEKAEPILYAHLSDVQTATRYNLKEPQIAWRSVLLVLQKQTDVLGGRIVDELSKLLFLPYGIYDPEMFLSGVDSNILTANVDKDGDKPFVVATIRDEQKVVKSIAPKKIGDGATDEGINFWRSEDGEFEAAFRSNSIIIGSVEGVGSGFTAGAFPGSRPNKAVLERLEESSASITTIGRELNSDHSSLINLLSAPDDNASPSRMSYLTETRFTKSGMERKTTSDFGLIGSIVAQLAQD